MNNHYGSEKELNQDKNIGEDISDSLEDNLFENHDESYLLNELSKLKESSREAVEDDNLSEYKKYLHIERDIQEEFYEAVSRAANFNSSHLVMICGSSGDGKSHLIGNLKKDDLNLFNKFTIISDATESFDQDKNAVDTLVDVLKSFNDYNINSSTEKLILGINLGILNQFLASPYADKEYTQLKSIIEEYNLFESDDVSENIFGEKISLVTFSDYNIFELNDDEKSNFVSSKYLSDLFNKITQNDYSNPFYVAYDKDKRSNYIHPAIYNYEMLMDEEVQKTIIEYLIKIFIKYKKIIPTRELLNFIYDIIVPPESVKNNDLNNIHELMDYSLPNLLFGSQRSDLLRLFNELDPALYRNEILDQFIIELNIKEDTEKVLDTFFDLTQFNFLNEYKECLIKFKRIKKSEDKRKVTNTLIRFAVFSGKSIIKDNFKDEVYLRYLRYLYAYNKKSIKGYYNLFNEIKEAIFNWKGRDDKNKICIDILNSFKLYKDLKFKIIPDKSEKRLSHDSNNRFKTEIKVYFCLESNKKKIPLTVDYSLYEYITKLYNGFKPNKSDKDNLIILDELINNLLSEDSDKDLEVISLEKNERFSLESNFGIFEFKER